METDADKMVPVATAEQPDAVPVEQGKDVMSKAEELIKIKLQSDETDVKIDMLKNELAPYVKLNPIKTANGQIFYVVGSTSKFINRDRLKQVMIEQLRISEQVAEQILTAGSLDKVIQPYVKVVAA
jgi:hypothetical protein